MNEERLISLKEASQYLAISIHTLRKWLRQRRLSFIKLGRRVLFTKGELENFINHNIVTSIKTGDPKKP